MIRQNKVVKKISIFLLIGVFALSTLSPSINVSASEIVMKEIKTYDSPTTRSDATGWRYKIVDGKLYKRLFNYSNNSWIGSWIYCP